MTVRAGFDGHCKEHTWLPVTVGVTNRGEQVTGNIEVSVPNQDGRTHTTYLRPVSLGSRANQTFTLYVRGASYAGRPTVVLRSGRGVVAQEQPASITWLSPGDTLIAVLAKERGTLSFLSGTVRQGSVAVASPYGGPSPPQTQVRVADCDPDALPDLAQGYASVDLFVLGEVSGRDLRPQAREALRRWVLAGGTMVVMGGPDWARLNDPFFQELLPVEVMGAAELSGVPSLVGVYGGGQPAPVGPLVVTRSSARPGAVVRVAEGGVPLVVEGAAGSGRVIFLAFDATRGPLRGWAGQEALWNALLDRAGSARPLLDAALSGSQPSYGGPFGRATDRLAAAVANVPAMRVPPFWWVAGFLGAYLLLLVPVNYAVLKWRKRREWAWLTTPVIVVVFVLLAYGIGYGMKGGRLVVNQFSLIETSAGAKAAGVTTFAGLFSPAKTSYTVGSDDGQGVISEASFDMPGRGRSLSVLQTETMSLPGVDMDMWTMRVFRMEGLTDLKGGLVSDLTITGTGHVVGQVINRTGLDLRGCAVRVAGKQHQIGDLAEGASVNVDVDVGKGTPAQVSGGFTVGPGYGPGPGYGGGPGTSPQAAMEGTVNEVFFGAGMRQATVGRALFSGWSGKRMVGLTVDDVVRASTSSTFLIVHLRTTAASRGPVLVPYGMAEGVIVEEEGTSGPQWHDQTLGLVDGYVVKEFRLPLGGVPLKVDELKITCDFQGAPGNTKLQVYHWEKGSWTVLSSPQGEVVAPDPAAHVRLPEGLVRVRLAHHPSGTSDGLQLSTMDVSLRGRR